MISTDDGQKNSMEKLYRFIAAERQQEPSPWLASKIGRMVVQGETRAPRAFLQTAGRPLLAVLLVIVSAVLGFQFAGEQKADKAVPGQAVYFNEMALEYPERVLLK